MTNLVFKDKQEQLLEYCDTLQTVSCGIVESVQYLEGQSVVSGKEVCVLYVNFDGYVSREWRTWQEIEVEEISEYSYQLILTRLHRLEAIE
jgi:hypothetical protein